jgi:hypothetical protein
MQLGEIDQMCVSVPRLPPLSCPLHLDPIVLAPNFKQLNPRRAWIPRYAKVSASGLNITYTYSYGCLNTFTMMVTPAPAGQKPLPPGSVEYSDCDYSLRWVTATEQTSTCTPPVVPPSECEVALQQLCSRAKRSSKGNCFICTGQHQQAFLQAHCAQHDFDSFCSA